MQQHGILDVGESRKVGVMGIKFVGSMLAVTGRNRINNEAIREIMEVHGVHEIVKEARLRCSMYSRSSMYPTNIQYLNNSPNSDVSGQTTVSHNIWSSQVSLGSEDAYTSTGAKTVSSTLPGFNQRYSSGGGGGGSGAATLQGFTSPHRSSPYSPTPAPAHASTLSGYSEAGNGAALWGSYDPSLQQYGVVTSANSSGTRGRTTSVASLSAAASLSASEY
uniref:Uncharacterized protein n=1 Tax=Timema shepardi TaxID=629360 RepID=A0A7R9ASP3_TIMSH|nr:unnamed protein product [Timema shepardi]